MSDMDVDDTSSRKRSREDDEDDDEHPAKRMRLDEMVDDTAADADGDDGQDADSGDEGEDETMGGFLVNSDDEDEVDFRDRGRKKKKKKRKKKKSHHHEALTLDEERMLHEQFGGAKPFRPDLDLDEDIDDDEDDEQYQSKRFKMRTDDAMSYFSDDDFLDDSFAEPTAQRHHFAGDYPEQAFVVNDNYVGDDNMNELAGFFGTGIYQFLGVKNSSGRSEETAAREAQRRKEAAARLKRSRAEEPEALRIQRIIETDVPERLQQRIEMTTADQIDDEVLLAEAEWISSQLFPLGRREEEMLEVAEEDIVTVLRFIREDHYDIPYIHQYCRDDLYHNPKDDRHLTLDKKELWAIDELDEKWQTIYIHKRKLLEQYEVTVERLTNSGEAVIDNPEAMEFFSRMLRHLPSIRTYLEDSQRQEELDDVEQYLKSLPLNDNANSEKKIDYPDKPIILSDEISTLIKDLDPTKGRREYTTCLKRVDDFQNDLHKRVPKRLRALARELDEFQRVRDFYQKCLDNQDEAENYHFDHESIESEELHPYLGVETLNEPELLDACSTLDSYIAKFKSSLEKHDPRRESKEALDSIREYLEECINRMPKQATFKRPARRSSAQMTRADELESLINQIGSSSLLASNIPFVNDTDSIQAFPIAGGELQTVLTEISASHPGKHKSPDSVRQMVIHLMSRRIAHEPAIRKWVRDEFEHFGYVNTQPTPQGRDNIEWNDPLACVKRLSRKPVSKFFETGCFQYVLIDKGVPNLLKVEVFCEDPTLHNEYSDDDSLTMKYFLDKLRKIYCTSQEKDDWTELRLEVLRQALGRSLIPMGQKAIQAKMLEFSRKSVLERAVGELENIAMLGSYRQPQDQKKKFKIMACVVGDRQSPSYVAVMNDYGELFDHMTFHDLKTFIKVDPAKGPTRAQKPMVQRKNLDLQAFKDFVRSSKPDLIVLDAGHLDARHLKLDIEKALNSIESRRRHKNTTPDPDMFDDEDENVAEDDEEHIRVEYVDPRVSLAYRNSDDARKEFESLPVGLRQAVCLGRFALSPISELCNRWRVDSKSGKNDILTLAIDPLVCEIPDALALQAYQKKLMDVVNHVGVELNPMFNRPHLCGALKFVCGLGEHKAAHIIRILNSHGFRGSRDELKSPVEEDEVRVYFMHQKVWENCIGFIRINQSPESIRFEKETDMPLLDDTRIHPKDYRYGKLVVANAMETGSENYTNELLKDLRDVEELKQLESLDLDNFANDFYEKSQKKIGQTLQVIKEEVREAFRDPRQLAVPTETQLFHWMTGESEQTIHPGMVVFVEVMSIQSHGVRCSMDSGLSAWLPGENISSECQEELQRARSEFRHNPEEEKTAKETAIQKLLSVGLHIEAKVIEVEPARFSVKITMLPEEMNAAKRPPNADEYLVMDDPKDDPKAAIKEKRRKFREKNPFIPRRVDYPRFQNVSREGAETMLAKASSHGMIMFRPSSKGLDFMSMTWKMASDPDIFVHFSILEREKPNGNPYGVGAKLQIEGYKDNYSDLDEIDHDLRSVLNELVTSMTDFGKFRFGDEQDIEEMLRAEKRDTPNSVAYAVSYSYKHPGYFVLTCIPNRTNARAEFIKLTPQGYKFRSKYFGAPSNLINYWKTHFGENHAKMKKKVLASSQPRKPMSPSPMDVDQSYNQAPPQHASSQHMNPERLAMISGSQAAPSSGGFGNGASQFDNSMDFNSFDYSGLTASSVAGMPRHRGGHRGGYRGRGRGRGQRRNQYQGGQNSY